jgi:hypothetical protein
MRRRLVRIVSVGATLAFAAVLVPPLAASGAGPANHRVAGDRSHIVLVVGGKHYLIYTIRDAGSRDGMYAMYRWSGRSRKLPGPVLGAHDGASIANTDMAAPGPTPGVVSWWNVASPRYLSVSVGSNALQGAAPSGLILRNDTRHKFVFLRPRDRNRNTLTTAHSSAEHAIPAGPTGLIITNGKQARYQFLSRHRPDRFVLPPSVHGHLSCTQASTQYAACRARSGSGDQRRYQPVRLNYQNRDVFATTAHVGFAKQPFVMAKAVIWQNSRHPDSFGILDAAGTRSLRLAPKPHSRWLAGARGAMRRIFVVRQLSNGHSQLWSTLPDGTSPKRVLTVS